VAETFSNNFAEHGELGAALCVTVDGRVVVDMFGGYSSADKSERWAADQLVNAFSVGKGITAIVAARCVTMGLFEYDTLVTTLWPEFGVHGKEILTVGDLLGHRSGLPSFREPQSPEIIFDWLTITQALAQESPWWEPGTAHGYHVNTFGFLIGEVIRRASGVSVGTLLHNELSTPLSADVFIGLPANLHHRVADLQWTTESATDLPVTATTDEQLMQMNAYSNPPNISGREIVNTPQWRSAEMPSTNTHASARGVCRLYTPLATGHSSHVSPAVLRTACTEVSNGTDRILGRTTRFGQGFQLPIPERGFGPNAEAFGHYGAGGSLGFADPATKVGFGYVMNQMGKGWQNARNRALVDSLYACL
jgi:CubicO group peptidase (beta-lactamase class C family)